MEGGQDLGGSIGADVAELQLQRSTNGDGAPQPLVLDTGFRHRASDRMARHHKRKGGGLDAGEEDRHPRIIQAVGSSQSRESSRRPSSAVGISTASIFCRPSSVGVTRITR